MGSYAVLPELALSKRALDNVTNRNEFFESLIELMGNTYNEKTNPNGMINLAIAENSFMQKVVFDYLNENLRLESKQLTYGDGTTGSVRLRTNLSKFVNTYFHPVQDVKPEEIIVSSGVSGITDQLAWALCNEGDGVLVGKPVYSGFPKDLQARSRVLTVPVSFGDTDPFSIEAIVYYEQELRNFNNTRSGARIRAVLLANPHNPLGRCYPLETLKGFMRFCQEHHLHLITDEIYALSTFKSRHNENAVGFYSILSIDTTDLIDPTRLHVLYGMSKDFSSNGLRLGLVISRNRHLIEAMSSITIFSWPSAPADLAWCLILEDTAFLTYYLSEHQKRLGEGYEFLANILDKLRIPYTKGGNYGFFLWVDLSFALEKPEHGGDPGIKEDEKLNDKLLKGGVFLASGLGYQAEKSGWYRITFSQPKKLLLMGLEKLMKILKGVDIDLSAEYSAFPEEGLERSRAHQQKVIGSNITA